MSALKNDLGSSGPPGRMRERVKELLRPRPGSKGINRHVQRYAPLYVLGMIWLVMVAAFPTVLRSSGALKTTGGPGQTSAAAPGETAPGTTAAGPESVTRTGGPSAVVGRAKSPTGGFVGTVSVGTGVTRGGFQCKPGVRQIPVSQYANPCVAKFEGGNGGDTFRGVTKDTIRIAMRSPIDPNAEAVEQARIAAGQASNEVFRQVFMTYVDYFNKTMELFGRRVVIESFTGQGNAVEEAQSRGRELACIDATAVADKGYFGVIRYPPLSSESEPFSDCASQRKIFIPTGANYFPEQYYQRWHPYVWSIRMECERIAKDFAEYVGKRLGHLKAIRAGDPLYQTQERVFGAYVPNNDGYQRCVDIFEKIAKDQYNVTIKHRVNYNLDVSQFASQAAAAVVQFKDAGVTSLINACDSLSTGLLIDNAQGQNWKPEWIIIGVDSQDQDGRGRAWDKGAAGNGREGTNSNMIQGHLFGPGQLGNDAKIYSKDQEAALVYKLATGKDIPAGSALVYFIALDLFNKLQAAGPILTADNIALGLRKLPPAGGSTGAWGTWSYADDHTAADDSREVYWIGTANGFDGKKGTFLETYGGRRFSSGQWPAEEPPIYP